MTRVFVYGTLKRGLSNYHVMKEAGGIFLTSATSREKLELLSTDLPYLLHPDLQRSRGHRIEGEIFELDDTGLARLDLLEDHPRSYRRELARFQTGDGELEAWVYYYVLAWIEGIPISNYTEKNGYSPRGPPYFQE